MREKDFSGYDVVFHVAGIAHVNAKKNMEALILQVNTDLAIETAATRKEVQYKAIHLHEQHIVYGESKSPNLLLLPRIQNRIQMASMATASFMQRLVSRS